MKKILLIVAALSAMIGTPAMAYDAMFSGKITMLESSYMPSQVLFNSDTGTGTCSAGTLLKWTARGATDAEKIANTQAVLSVLLTARATGGTLRFYVTLSTCEVEFIHFL